MFYHLKVIYPDSGLLPFPRSNTFHALWARMGGPKCKRDFRHVPLEKTVSMLLSVFATEKYPVM